MKQPRHPAKGTFLPTKGSGGKVTLPPPKK